MIGVTEDVGARTFIHLELLEAWSPNAPGNPVARIHGGPGPDGVTVGFPVSLRKGEVVGILLIEPVDSEDSTRDTKGFYGLYVPGIFHDVGDGFTNGQLFSQRRVSVAELGAFITAAVAKAGSPDCPDVLPDTPEYPDGAGEDVIGPEVRGEPVNDPRTPSQ
jgi:hypothetical protein